MPGPARHVRRAHGVLQRARGRCARLVVVLAPLTVATLLDDMISAAEALCVSCCRWQLPVSLALAPTNVQIVSEFAANCHVWACWSHWQRAWLRRLLLLSLVLDGSTADRGPIPTGPVHHVRLNRESLIPMP